MDILIQKLFFSHREHLLTVVQPNDIDSSNPVAADAVLCILMVSEWLNLHQLK